MKITILTTFLICLTTLSALSQAYNFGFQKNLNVEFQDVQGSPISNPFAGGLNCVQFQQIDLNLDGKMDLVTFDKHGDKLLTYINLGTTGQINYKFAPEYIKLFPDLSVWIQLIDYDGDGKNDIFSYFPGGICVYKNTSTTSGGLNFSLITNMINSLYAPNQSSNIYCGPTDYPAITDIDYDGDLDILNFGIMGQYIDFHKNLSKELHGDANHLSYKRVEKCWGKFAESDSSNTVILNVNCTNAIQKKEKSENAKHVGSSLLAIDLNGDSVKDLLLGDVDFFRITALMNGGTKDSAKIISQDNNFPSNDTAIKIVTFPALNYLDIDNDGVNELIATPFEDVYHKPSGKNQIWLYENSGTSILPIFHLVKKNFLQETMVDVGEGATPTVVDVDRDGLMDIIIGNYGDVDSVYYDTLWNNLYTYKNASLTYYRNIGTSTNPKFKLITNDWQGLKSYKYSAIKPTFGDLDFDGDQDLIIGNEKGTLSYFQNIAATNSPISLSSPIDFYQGIDSSYFAAPQLFDMNHDSLLDLVIGNKLGLISYYKNTGTKTLPAFTLVTDTLGKVHTNDYWNFNYANSYPNFYKDERDTFCLMAGSAAGYVFYYNRIESNLSGEFLKDSLQKFYRYWDTIRYDSVFSAVFWQSSYNSLHFIDEGMRTCPVLYDFNNDGYLDLLIGNFAGGISFYNGMKPLHIGINHIKIDQENFKLFPNPTTDYVNLELNNYADFNEMEIQIYETSGKLIKSIKCVPSQQINIPLTEFGNRSVLFIKIEAKDHEGKMHFATKKLIRY